MTLKRATSNVLMITQLIFMT